MNDPILTFLAPALAAVIAALFGIGRLIGDKEVKVTEFRKSWIESLRSDISDFSASCHLITGRIVIRKKHHKDPPTPKFPFPRPKPTSNENLFDRQMESELVPHWETLRKSYNSIILHINPIENYAYVLAQKYLTENKFDSKTPDEKLNVIKELIEIIETTIQNIEKRSCCKKLIEKLNKIPTKLEKLHNKMVWHDDRRPLDQILIKEACTGYGDALLLGILASTKLLEADYHAVASREPDVVKAISLVDRAGSHVIKETWEKIKMGERRYRVTTQIFTAAGCIMFFIAVYLGYNHWEDQKSGKALSSTPQSQQVCVTIPNICQASSLTK